MERCLTIEGTTEKATLTAVDEPTEKPMYDTIIDNWAENMTQSLFTDRQRKVRESREVSQAEDQRLRSRTISYSQVKEEDVL